MFSFSVVTASVTQTWGDRWQVLDDKVTMISASLASSLSDATQIDDRIATACELVTEQPDLVTGMWVCGLLRCGETFASIRAAERRWNVHIAVLSPDQGDGVTLKIRLAARPRGLRANACPSPHVA